MVIGKEQHEWGRMSTLLASLYICHGDGKKKFKPEDFNPFARKKNKIIGRAGWEIAKAAFGPKG